MTAALWRDGNRVQLLENGEEYYPRVFAAIAAAKFEVLIETFIIFEDPIGNQLKDVLIEAAGRGLRVELCADGYGTADLSAEYIGALTAAGVHYHIFDPRPKLAGMRINLFRRLHRKIVVVDSRVAFVGGINFSVDHVRESGPESKQDYAVEVEGPVVHDIRRLSDRLMAPARRRMPIHWLWRVNRMPPPEPTGPSAGSARCALVHRDNERHRDDIERHYRDAIRRARREILIANAYFFPGWRLLRDLRKAARRGVKVRLVLQGNPDQPSVRFASTMLYDFLLRSGIVIYEYCERPLHGKVAVVDDEWSTVGSSNLDPLSLFLNLEANVVIVDREFTAHLRTRLHDIMQNSCTKLSPARPPRRTWWRGLLTYVAFQLLRRVPWAVWSRGGPPLLVSHRPGRLPSTTTLQTPLPGEPALPQSGTTGTR